MAHQACGEEGRLVEKYQERIEAFRREVCLQSNSVDPSEELEWFSLTVGWLCARGVDHQDARGVASLIRYTFQYWM